jgi:hypothetical protein
MAQSISQSQLHLIKSGQLDLMGEDVSSYKTVTFNDLADTMARLGAKYVERLVSNLNKADASSSGKLSDSITNLDVTLFGSVYTVEIEAAKYAKFLDEGVDGWAKSRGSQYKFKTRGVDPQGEMVKSVKEWLLREGKFSRNVKTQLSKRESKQKSLVDATTKQAISVAYMIKRQGIKPTHFWRDTTREMKQIVEVELGKALKVDIVNSLVV